MTKKIVGLMCLALIVVAAIVVVRTETGNPSPAKISPAEKVAVPPEAIDRLAAAVRLPTISPEDPKQFNPQPFAEFRAYLAQALPAVHSTLVREAVGEHSLLYTWRGSDEKLAPVLLLAHYDVVPIEPGTESKWSHPPFSGEIADGAVWGRGSLDDKGSLMAIFEAAEMLLRAGYQPQRTVLIAIGHDEEIGGKGGARLIAELLKQRSVKPTFVLDEGIGVVTGALPGISKPLAILCTGDKGYLSVELSAEARAGHSSVPPRQTAIGIVSAGITRLEKQQMPLRLLPPTRKFLEAVAPEMPFGKRVMVSNLWLFEPLVLRGLGRSDTTNAVVRTTTAATIISGGAKANALPSTARAVVNFRILPGDTIDSVLEHVKRTIDDPRVALRVVGVAENPPPISPTDSDGYHVLEQTAREVFPDALVTSSIMVGITDARYYSVLTPNVYRFDPFRTGVSDLQRAHGTDERISVNTYHDAIRFYRRLILNASDRQPMSGALGKSAN